MTLTLELMAEGLQFPEGPVAMADGSVLLTEIRGGTLTRIWPRRGARPLAPRDTRCQWAYVFGAVRPARGAAAGLVMPFADTPAMTFGLRRRGALARPCPGPDRGADLPGDLRCRASGRNPTLGTRA